MAEVHAGLVAGGGGAGSLRITVHLMLIKWIDKPRHVFAVLFLFFKLLSSLKIKIKLDS